MRSSFLAFAVLVLSAPAHAEPEPRSEPPPEALAQAWFDQALGFDALEAYRLASRHQSMEFALARKWKDGAARILIDVLEPADVSKWGILLLQNARGTDDYFIYPDLFGRVRQLRTPEFSLQLPYSGSLLPVGELRPYLPGELRFRRLPDELIDGEPCRVVRGERLQPYLYYDGVELALSARTGVALRTRYLRGGRELTRVEVSPADVRRYDDGRWLPSQRRIRNAESAEAVLVLRNLMIDPVLPDRLFTRHSLRFPRFPAF